MRRIIESTSIALLLFLIFIKADSQTFPPPAYPYPLLNDFAGILTQDEADALEIKLELLFDTTAMRIITVTIDDLKGLSICDYASGLGDSWGFSLKSPQKLVIILVKPGRKGSPEEVCIAIGSAIKELIPNDISELIVQREINPLFKKGSYYAGLNNATDVLISLGTGAYRHAEYSADKTADAKTSLPSLVFRVLLVLTILLLAGRIIVKSR
jgi:uncharacterized protein